MVSNITSLTRVPEEKPKSSAKELSSAVRSFQETLTLELQKQEKVKLSAHVQKRLKQRNIKLEEEDWQKISNAVSHARKKGVKDSLLLYHDLALVTSIKNGTIITALEGKDMENHVFTNIDGAVIIK